MWIEGMEACAGNIKAKLFYGHGTYDFIAPSELGTKGLPNTTSKNLRLHDVSLHDFVKGDAREYVAAFGMDSNEVDTSRHPVYKLTGESTSLVVPALAFMRGIFKPTQTVLPALFRPQALDSICVPSRAQEKLVDIVAPWAAHSYRRLSDPRLLLSWLYHDTDARKLAASVHLHAMRGSLDLDLPDVRVAISVQGKRDGSTIYVTRANINRINEAQSSGSESWGEVRLSCTTKNQSTAGELVRLQPLAHCIGANPPSDREWSEMHDAFRLTPAELRMKADMRAVFACILRKLHSGARWKDVGTTGLSTDTIVFHYSKWIRSGRLFEVLSLLKDLRKKSDSC